MSQPLVSVMMPAWNTSRFISDAIKSMQQQTYQNWQLCIVDDGSDDLTYEIAQTFLIDPRICVTQILHSGCPTARNACLKMAEGDIIARLDADDTHEPERLEQQVNFLLENDDSDIVTCNMNWLKGGMKLQKKTGAMIPRTYMSGISNGPCCASVVAWKRVYDLIGDFDSHLLAGSDGDWNFRAIIKKMRWGHLYGYWYNQRRHLGQLSQTMRSVQRRVHAQAREKYSKIWRTGL